MRMLHVDPLIGFQDFHGRRLAYEAGIAADVIRPVGAMLGKLYDVFVAEDATLVEVNPLLITKAREVVALDAKVTIDDNALWRHPELEELKAAFPIDPVEERAKDAGLQYVKLDGTVGIIGNGAGLVMSTLDVVAQAGARAANFLDIGGGASVDTMSTSLEVILSDPSVKAVLINIFGGITRCDLVAQGILEALVRIEAAVPIVVRLDGTNARLGREILNEAAHPRIVSATTMLEAARNAADLANAGEAA
jgi:succinyl-CoA synthetase beta subunit